MQVVSISGESHVDGVFQCGSGQRDQLGGYGLRKINFVAHCTTDPANEYLQGEPLSVRMTDTETVVKTGGAGGGRVTPCPRWCFSHPSQPQGRAQYPVHYCLLPGVARVSRLLKDLLMSGKSATISRRTASSSAGLI